MPFYSKNQLLEIENNFFTSWLEMQECQGREDSKQSAERTDGGCKQHWKLGDKEQGEMLELTDIVTQRKPVFVGLLCWLDIAKERSFSPEWAICITTLQAQETSRKMGRKDWERPRMRSLMQCCFLDKAQLLHSWTHSQTCTGPSTQHPSMN